MKKELKPDKPIAIVTWGDASYSSLRYYDKHKKHEPIVTQTVGYLLEYDDERLLMYADYFEDGDYRNEILIPSVMIISVYILEIA